MASIASATEASLVIVSEPLPGRFYERALETRGKCPVGEHHRHVAAAVPLADVRVAMA